MKKIVLLLFLFLIVVGCKNDTQLTFEPSVFSNDTCKDCPKVAINIPKALDNSKIAESINSSLREELISLLTFDEETEVATIDEALTSFNNGYLEIKKKFNDESENWEADINGIITFENKNLLALQLDTYMFTGGAHGYSSVTYLNFDKKKGIELENWELFKDNTHFIKFAETKFRIQEGIPQGSPINSTGFMFENEVFHLPINIGFNKEGLVLHYNQYEVASFADGPIIVILPFDEIKNYLSFKIKP
ncbi:hypothetical protein GGR42_001719 [Saonia flava]|uniref:Deacetylase PdaC domain-containing protein n=1 Tax=Saonia flava TaxID=523696 RepID=A0A846QVJ8_9FLAO|nr:DUF3298 and DUF4163 domain-containing protein [Saonia flava]NJB71257.1 hypothetical protein [Saonia flava]